MAQILGKKKINETSIHDLIISDNEMAALENRIFELFEIRLNSETVGPFHKEDLKKYLENDQSLFDELRIRQLKDSKWQMAIDHPYFQRRKPQIISTETLSDEGQKLYVLADGMKKGPFTTNEIKELVNKQELLVTDFVSTTGTGDWVKLFTYGEFDRRELKGSNDLPEAPSTASFDRSFLEVVNELQHSETFQEKTDALVGLAFATTRGHEHTHLVPPITREESVAKAHNKRSLTIVSFVSALIVTLVISLIFYRPNVSSTSNGPMADEQGTITNQKGVNYSGKINKDSNSQRAPFIREKANLKAPNTLRNTQSIKDTPVFEEANGGNEDFYYDENDGPVEQDPVRSGLSKDTIDPEEDLSVDTPFAGLRKAAKAIRNDENTDDNFSDAEELPPGPDSEQEIFDQESQF